MTMRIRMLAGTVTVVMVMMMMMMMTMTMMTMVIMLIMTMPELTRHRDPVVAKISVQAIHDIITSLLHFNSEMSYFHFNESLFKPYESLIQLELCDLDVQVGLKLDSGKQETFLLSFL